MKGKVYLVGAGPGDYKLITLKGLECIRKADVIVYDRLANINYLKEAKKGCEFINVGKASSHHLLPQDQINRLIADKALEGKIVTRLKGGDPYVFGRGGEEGELLQAENIDFEVVPGVTSAIGGLCYAGIPITHRDHASSFHVITGHLRKDGKENPDINWNALANMKGTLVFLMGVSNLKNISDNLIKEGMAKDTPVAFVSWATRYNQRVVTATLENAYEVAVREEVKPPTLIAVGTVVNLREKLNFFEKKPLFGKNIMVTRSRSQNSKLVERIMDLGGNPIEIPTIKIEKVENNIELENEIKNFKEYTYLVLTSKNGVDIFFDKLDEMGLDCRALANTKVCAIGSATSKAIAKKGIKADIVPSKAIGESLYDELKDIVTKEDKILIPRAKNARDFLVDKLNEISNVTEVITYESVMDDSKKDEAIKALEEGNLDYITFASSSTVKNFINLIGEENKSKLSNTKIISIGKITTKTILDNGLEVYKESEKASIESMIEAMCD
ncbi:MAG: uroporphyrinogen-III C-methyltransferase [Intestinibacter sp.]|uniref:uroporphyrinogen-III C-methyltransferase n=1 Tax=Intestinibacter sp. TaxID=1965304 RepID=UPI002A8241BD|nr:uroporphyrinogen-III C-methyltransferase [Intestinibacter sp.]MDY4575024.1 uroporphyrinogen-III C-methyltransferase [Intestinibacter sp.]